MKCQILKDKRTGKILDVLTPTGNKSITYEQLQSKYNYSPTDSAFYYSLTSSEQFQHFLLDDYSDAAARYISSQHLFTSIPSTLLTALAKAESTKSIQPLISYLNSSVIADLDINNLDYQTGLTIAKTQNKQLADLLDTLQLVELSAGDILAYRTSLTGKYNELGEPAVDTIHNYIQSSQFKSTVSELRDKSVYEDYAIGRQLQLSHQDSVELANINAANANNQGAIVTEVASKADRDSIQAVEDARENINYLLGRSTGVSIQDTSIARQAFNNALDNLLATGVHGSYLLDQTIVLHRNLQRGDEYHEAFHYVFRNLLSSKQVVFYTDKARRALNQPENKQVLTKYQTQIRNTYSSSILDQLTEQEIEQLVIEEYLADEYQKYTLLQLDANKLTSVSQLNRPTKS